MISIVNIVARLDHCYKTQYFTVLMILSGEVNEQAD